MVEKFGGRGQAMSAPTALSPAEARWGIAICFAALVLEGYDILMFGTVVPALLSYDSWDLDVHDIGWLGSITAIGMLLGSLTAATIADRWGRKRTLVTAVIVFSFGMVLAAAATSVTIFGIGRLLIGIGAGILMPTSASMLYEYARPDIRSRVVTYGFIGTCVGGLIAAGAAVVLVANHGFRPMFALGAIPGLLLIPFLIRKLPEIAPNVTAGDKVGIAQVFRSAKVSLTLNFWVLTFICMLLLFGVSTWLPELMRGAGYSVATALSFMIALNLGAIGGVLAFGWVADRIGIGRVTAMGFAAAASSLALLALQPPTAVAYLLILFAGAGSMGTQILLNAFIASRYPASCRTAALGLALAIGRIGAFAGPQYGAFVVATGAGFGWQLTGFAIPAAIAAGLAALAAAAKTSPIPPSGAPPSKAPASATPLSTTPTPTGQR